MKKMMAIFAAAALATATVGCVKSSPRGGEIAANEGKGFKISVPTMNNVVKQGQVETVTIKVWREDYFKQDIRLNIKTDEGISADPSSTIVKEGDKGEVQVVFTASKNAPLREHKVEIEGTPVSGKPTWVVFDLKVIAP